MGKSRRPRGYVERKETKKGSVRYYPVLVIDGKRKYHGGVARKRDADKILGELKQKVISGSYGREELSFRQLYERWIEAKSQSLSTSSLVGYESTFRLHVLDYLGDKLLSEITPLVIQDWIYELRKKDISPATIQKAYRCVRACLNQGRDWDVINKSPYRGIILPRKGHEEMDYLEPSELRRLLEVCEEPYKTLYITLAYSGLRLGETLGLAWKHIDFDNGAITVERSAYYRDGTLQGVKTASSRRAVPLLSTLASALKQHHQLQGRPNPDYLLFTIDGVHPFDQSAVRRRFNRYLDKAGLRHVTIHSLRHTFASVLLASGGSIKAVQRAVGHASAQMTLDVYGHLIAESLGETVRRADALLSGNSGTVVPFPREKRSTE